MTVLLYDNGEIKLYPQGYKIDGVLQPLGELQTGVQHLDYIPATKPVTELNEYATSEWVVDGTEYKQVWTVHTMTDAELAAHLTQLGEGAVNSVKEQLMEQLKEQQYSDNLTTIATLDDEAALEIPEQFPPFNPNAHIYTIGDRFYYPVNGKLYKVLQGHTSQPDWLPTTAVSLYEVVYVAPDNPCENTEAWNGANWGSYTVGYWVKHDNAIWEVTSTSHTYIAPAHSGDGAISWEHIIDCP